MTGVPSRLRSVRAGFTLGIGLGGFADGVLLHQIVQWHNMLSAHIAPTTMDAMKLNMRWDGFFHAATWLVTLLGVAFLFRDAHAERLPYGRAFVGHMLLGWGAFNLLEGLVDHHWLALHHVRDMPTHQPAYDWLFLLVGGLGLLVLGSILSRRRSVT